MNRRFKPGLYVLTPQVYPDTQRLVAETRAALAGGAAMVQFRDKSGDADWRLAAATALRAECEAYDAPLIINDDARLAASCGAAGVHLGKEDGSVGSARALAGDASLIGVSCYNNIDLARQAATDGADYLAFGSVFSSATKPAAVHCPLDVIRAATRFDRPLVAIGGITPDNGRAVIEAGATSLAVIGAVFGAADIQLAARTFAGLWVE